MSSQPAYLNVNNTPSKATFVTQTCVAGQNVAQLYTEHQPWLYKWLWGKLGCSFQAADLAQDTFVKVLSQQIGQQNNQTQEQLKTEQLREPRAYLQVLAQRTLFDFWRRKELEQSYNQSLLEQEENYYLSEETRALVLEALNQLDKILYSLEPISRQVFLLSQLRQFTYQEISEQMHMSVMTVRRHMKKAILACAGIK
jgi:RNA polymerase sigma-70 factor (ECF subfamily)